MSEGGANANTTYTAGTGSSNTGDTYSFGASNAAERALGGVQSSNLAPTWGASFTNNSGGAIIQMNLSYTGEEWRLGAAGRTDRLDFQYSLNATSLTTGTWIDVDTLDFSSPAATPTVGALDGNAAANRTAISSSVTSLNIPNGATFYIRWVDFNATGADDGLAVDDLTLSVTTSVPVDTAPTISSTTPANGATGVAADSNLEVTFSEDVTIAGNWYSISCASSGAHTAAVSGGPRTFTINPDSAFTSGESCTAAITAAQVTDQDGSPTPMAANYTWSFTVQAQASGCTGLFFSEYVEGLSNNKALEIFNGTSSTIDLSDYRLETYFNGASTYTQLLLNGSVASGDVFVVAHEQAVLGIAPDQTNNGGALSFNGDDAILLRRISDNAVLDVIGQVGFDPGTEWGTDLISTADNTMRRNASITSGDTNASDAFDPGGAWTGYATDTFDGLGSHTATCVVSVPSATTIHAVQGSGAASPLVGQSVIIEGIVVGDFQDTVSGFFVQEEDSDADSDPSTSEGIFVYSVTPVSVGDRVRVTGSVVEYYNETEISGSPVVTVINSGNTPPVVTNISLPIAAVADWERYEGMRVAFSQTLVVAETYLLGRGGQLTLADGRIYQPTHVALPGATANAVAAENARHIIVLDDGSQTQNPDPIRWPAPGGLSAANIVRNGDQVSGVQGILTYRWSGWSGTDAWRIYPTTNPTFTSANARPAVPSRNGLVRVVSFNVLNYFNGDGAGGGFPTARGANTLEEFTRQRSKIINAIIALDADVIGLMEIENDGYGPQSALQDLVNGLNTAAGSTVYALVNAGAVGSDEIRTAFIYRIAAVTPGATVVNNDAVFSRPPLAQTFTSAGQTFTVIVNHLKSKGCTGATGLDADQGDGQGCYNATRTDQAAALVTWINTLAATEPDILLIGDYNAYAREAPITTITAAGNTDLLNRFWGSAAYSYVFDGQLGYLDHALASASLFNQVTFTTHWHINADEPTSLDYNTEFKSAGQITSLYASSAYRSSDHDPVIVDLFMPCSDADASDLELPYGTAWHCGPHTAWLGSTVTSNANFLPGGDKSDNDGVSRLGTRWQPGASVGVRVTVSGNNGWLIGWFDWNVDGDFDDAGEKTVSQSVAIGQTDINFTVPANARVGLGSSTAIPSRFRLYESTTEPLSAISPDEPLGPAAINASVNGGTVGGEVEDYTFGFGPTAVTLAFLTARAVPSIGLAGLALLVLLAAIIIRRLS
jgi:predicted extracellular nuclease